MYEKVPECILKCNCEKQPSGSVLKKKVMLKISQNSHESACVAVSF